MKKLFLPLFVMMSASLYAASTTETVEVDGLERSYIVYTPSSSSKSHSVIVALHGLSGSAEGYAERLDAQAVSDLHNALVVFPQALPEQNSEVKTALQTMKSAGLLPEEMDVKNSWGAGARMSADKIKELAGSSASLLNFVIPGIMKKGYGELNEEVDDVHFINVILDNLSKNYKANDSIFVAGFSMGGAMAYKYAYSEGSKAKKICVMNGFVGDGVDTTGRAINKPLLIFHSEADEVVAYNGGMFNGSVSNAINTIAYQNGCMMSLSIQKMEDTADDGNLVTRMEYNCEEGKEIVFFLSDNADHGQVLNDQENDVDMLKEMDKFFYPSANAGNENIAEEATLQCYPNPVEDKLYCERSGRCVVADLTGRVVLSADVEEGEIDLSQLSAGYYIFTLKTKNETLRARIVKK